MKPKCNFRLSHTLLANMDNPTRRFLWVNNGRSSLSGWCRWHWRISPLLNTETLCAMQRFEGEIIDHRSTGAEVSTWGLRVFATNSSNYPRCDSKTNHLASVWSSWLWSVTFGRTWWQVLERPYTQLRTVSLATHWWDGTSCHISYFCWVEISVMW
jgi:hypothetical protein